MKVDTLQVEDLRFEHITKLLGLIEYLDKSRSNSGCKPRKIKIKPGKSDIEIPPIGFRKQQMYPGMKSLSVSEDVSKSEEESENIYEDMPYIEENIEDCTCM